LTQAVHPALSVIFFTTASGAGFALMILLGLAVPLGLLPANAGFGFVALAAAVALTAGGLASSTFHLGRPERAWRAFSQWRSSWLSREGVFSVLTFLPLAAFGIGWVVFGTTDGLIGLFGFIAAALAAATIYCTGMIYASLKPVHQWHNGWVVPVYLLLGLMSGLLALNFLVRFWVRHATGLALVTFAVVLIAWWIKERYWLFVDTTSARSTVASATALGGRGRVRMLETPHTEENYLLKEMGFQIARRHARRLRRIARLSGFLFPAVGSTLGVFVAGTPGTTAAGLAFASAALGIVIERWLFFAEAKHTVTLYYGADAV
jgi:sulfite dehydrogenase (quinone) subunit SoeC